MKLGFWLGGLAAAAVAVQVVGCLGAPFVVTGGTGAAGGGTSASSGNGGGGGVSVGTTTSSSASSSSGTGCPAGQKDCGAGCIDVQSDKANCGACHNNCGPATACSNGTCTCANAGDIYCASSVGCINPITNKHCGGCNACPKNTDVCTSGVCLCSGSGLLDCGGTCADVATDPLNCGGCNHQCSASEVCVSGKCKCRPGFTACPPPPATVFSCVDTQHDPDHCGTCNVACQGSTGKCNAGMCIDDCPPANPIKCDSGCYTQAQLDSDPVNCGSCGTSCQPNEACVGGACSAYFLPGACLACPCDACTNAPGYSCCPVMSGAVTFPVCFHAATCPGG